MTYASLIAFFCVKLYQKEFHAQLCLDYRLTVEHPAGLSEGNACVRSSLYQTIHYSDLIATSLQTMSETRQLDLQNDIWMPLCTHLGHVCIVLPIGQACFTIAWPIGKNMSACPG